ncbi:MAG: hypothetical protein V1772_07545 [Chloroflexota bacterium]
MGQWGAQFAWQDTLIRRYQQMPVDAILREFGGSWALPVAQVRRISTSTEDDDESGRETHKVRIEATAGKYDFILAGRTAGQAREILRGALGAVVR